MRSRVAARGRSASAGSTGRRFCFSAGIGLDAEAVRRVDRRGRDRDGRRAGNAIFAATVLGVLFEHRLRIESQLELDGFGRAAMLFVANGRPYTYAGPLPVTITGEADFAAGLDFVAPREVSPRLAPSLAFRGIRGTLARDPSVLAGHDVDELHVRCDRPLPLQADGEDLGDVDGGALRGRARRARRFCLGTQIQSVQRARLIPSSRVKPPRAPVFTRCCGPSSPSAMKTGKTPSAKRGIESSGELRHRVGERAAQGCPSTKTP